MAVNRNGEHVVDNSTAFSAETSKAWERLDSAETTIDFFCREKRKLLFWLKLSKPGRGDCFEKAHFHRIKIFDKLRQQDGDASIYRYSRHLRQALWALFVTCKEEFAILIVG